MQIYELFSRFVIVSIVSKLKLADRKFKRNNFNFNDLNLMDNFKKKEDINNE